MIPKAEPHREYDRPLSQSCLFKPEEKHGSVPEPDRGAPARVDRAASGAAKDILTGVIPLLLMQTNLLAARASTNSRPLRAISPLLLPQFPRYPIAESFAISSTPAGSPLADDTQPRHS
jgi:hypothetical protein